MKRLINSTMLIISVFTLSLNAQQTLPELTSKDSIVSSSWIFGLGVNIVDDSGSAFNNMTSIKNKWNIVPFPSRLSIGRYFASGLGLELIGTYNQYKEGNTIDGNTITEDIPYWAADARLSYDLNKLVGETGFFDPYLGVGLGYTDANNIGRGTYNAVVGFRLWFTKQWGMDINGSGKWSFGNEATNHIQYGIGAAYRFGIKEELSRKGREKLALRQEMEAAMQREQDSIQAVRDAEERQRQLAMEQAEAERLAAERAAAQKREAEAQRREALRSELEAIGPVGFAFDSSYLSTEAKSVLEEIAAFMKSNPGLRFRVDAYADSRGDAKYNQWLSERRAQRALDFLSSQGIDQSRLEAVGHGEEDLLNHCADGVRCTAAEHAVNRRSKITISDFGGE